MSTTKAGSIIINIRAGTKQLKTDLNDGSRTVQEFGKKTVTSMQGASAAIRLASGDVTHNVRAVEAFITKTLGMGDALKAVFPVVGAIAFGGLIVALATKVGNFFNEITEKAASSRLAFANLDASVRLTNDGLAVTNSRLKNELAQIDGLPQNNLRTALLEAQEAAHKLNQELERSIEDRRKLIVDQPEGGNGFTGWMKRTFMRISTGSVGTKDIADRMREFEQQTQGLEGGPLKSALATELTSVKAQLAASLDQQDRYAKEFSLVGAIRIGDPSQRIEDLKHYKKTLEEFQTTVKKTDENSGLGVKIGAAQDKKAAEMLDRPFQNKLKELQAELQGAQEKFEGVGTAAGEVMGAGLGKAAEDIESVNKQLEKRGPMDQMNALQALQIVFTDTAIAQVESETKLQTALVKTTDTLKDRIKAQEILNSSIGGTYAQRQKSFANSALYSALGAENYKNATADQLAPLQALLKGEFAGQESGAGQNALQQLSDRVRLTEALAAAERNGYNAIKDAELAERIAVETRGKDIVTATALTMSLTAEDAAQRKLDAGKKLESIQAEATARDRLANAIGRQAKLQAEAANAYDRTYKETGSTAAAQAASTEVIRAEHDEILTKAHEEATAFADQLSRLKEMDQVLKGINGTEAARHELEQQILDLEIKNDLAQNSVKAGIDAYFLEMQRQSKTTGEIISETLMEATDKVTNELANMATGKRCVSTKMRHTA